MASKERPILFTGEMVRAILDGRKSQTRRVIKSQPTRGFNSVSREGEYWVFHSDKDNHYHIKAKYEVGDRLWVRETWRCTGGGSLRNIIYKAEGDTAMSYCGVDDGRTGILHVPEPHWAEWDRLVYKTDRGCNWRSPIHMYKWAARIWLEITRVSVERVQDIKRGDVLAEGVGQIHIDKYLRHNFHPDDAHGLAFRELWDSINAKRGYGWDFNPWVWVVELRKVK